MSQLEEARPIGHMLSEDLMGVWQDAAVIMPVVKWDHEAHMFVIISYWAFYSFE